MDLTREQKMAYTEVCEVLKHLSKDDVNKIPKDILEYYTENADSNYKFIYDDTKIFKEQPLSDTAKVVLAILYRDYWATPQQRDQIYAKEKSDIQFAYDTNTKKYNINLITGNNSSANMHNNNNNNTFQNDSNNVNSNINNFTENYNHTPSTLNNHDYFNQNISNTTQVQNQNQMPNPYFNNINNSLINEPKKEKWDNKILNKFKNLFKNKK